MDDTLATANFWLPYIERVKFWAEIGVIASLAIGLIAARIGAPFSKQIDDAREIKIAQLTNDAARLKTEGDEARSDIAQANARAAEATQKAEEERLARVRLEAKLADRSITAQERQELSDKLRPFAGTSVDIFVVPTAATKDTVPLSRLIVSILVAAGWQIRDLHTASGGQFFPGFVVGKAAGNPSIDAAVDALVGGLNAANIDATIGPLFRGEGIWTGSGPGGRVRALLATPPAPISITIGSKP